MTLKTTRANIENFRTRAETPSIRCRCGGTLRWDSTKGASRFGDHSEPICPAYDAIDTCADLVDFSAQNAVATDGTTN